MPTSSLKFLLPSRPSTRYIPCEVASFPSYNINTANRPIWQTKLTLSCLPSYLFPSSGKMVFSTVFIRHDRPPYKPCLPNIFNNGRTSLSTVDSPSVFLPLHHRDIFRPSLLCRPSSRTTSVPNTSVSRPSVVPSYTASIRHGLSFECPFSSARILTNTFLKVSQTTVFRLLMSYNLFLFAVKSPCFRTS